MFRFRKTLFAATLALGLAAATSASADTILFNPDGTGAVGAIEVDAFDQAVGNALAQDVFLGSPVPTDFTLLYQSNLAQATESGAGVVFTQGDGGNYFTFAAGFGETLTGIVPGFPAPGNVTLGFAFDDSEPNFFNMYATTADGDNLAGLGFTTGTLILSGHAIAEDFISQFTFSSVLPSSARDLDQFGDDNYPETDTLRGSGSANINVVIDTVDSGYFPEIAPGTIIQLAITSTTLRLPFGTVDPSALFSSDGVADGDTPGVASVGAINALSGPNTMLQADASSEFQLAQVPEPASLTLFGLGLLGSVAAIRRRRQASR